MAKKKTKFTPLHDRVLVIPDETDQVSEGGILIPDAAKEKPSTGTVMAAGPGRPGIPMQAKAGDRVLFSKFSATDPIEFLGSKFIVMREDEILTTFEEGDETASE